MKFGIRKPSLKKSIKARTTGKLKRSIKKSINPFYGKKGVGFITNPKKALYNKVYNKTSFSIFKPLKLSSPKLVSNPRAYSSPSPDLYENLKNITVSTNAENSQLLTPTPLLPKSLQQKTEEEIKKHQFALLRLHTNRYAIYNVEGPRARIVMLFVILFTGFSGIHWFYSGRIKRGLFYLFTVGGLGILWMKDLVTYALSLGKKPPAIIPSKQGIIEYLIPMIEIEDNGFLKQIIDPMYEQEVSEDLNTLAQIIK